ncbi:MAG: hypothetical protein PHW76_10335, partial [Alphaproteobacteria bacterium]|nr:hypothetical protein [Alphaproteobacteria bacterium]
SDASPAPLPCVTDLPDKNNSLYNFYTITYKKNGVIYVLTYIPPPVTGTDKYDLVCIPGFVSNVPANTACPRRLPITYEELYSQLGRTVTLSPVSFGVVRNTAAECGTVSVPCLVSAASSPLDPTVFPVPSTNVPVKSIGIIGIATPCSDCAP